MRILFVGDIFGRPGREAVRRFVPEIRRDENVDFVIANGENASHGAGITPAHGRELFDSGVDVITLGNHTWDKKEVGALLSDPRVLRPANYPPTLPGQGYGVYPVNGIRVGVLQVMGRHHMATIDCPFRTADDILSRLKADVIFVDVHAEASSEKQALAWYMDGRVAAVVGSHTHVQTADERLLPGGTAYLGDAGMTGPRDGIIGGERGPSIQRFLTGVRVHFGVAEGDAQFCACLVDVDESTGRARSLKRFQKILERKKGSRETQPS
jgi:metallophosphoesterase (TIGR00282 family)